MRSIDFFVCKKFTTPFPWQLEPNRGRIESALLEVRLKAKGESEAKMKRWDSSGRLIGMAKKDCKLCEGTGWKLVNDVQGTPRAQPCECMQDRVPVDRLIRAKIPPRYEIACFENFEVRSDGLSIPLAFAKRFVEDWVPPVEFGLAFIGPPGVGKTHLAVSVIRELVLRKGVECLFVDFRELLQQIRNSFNPATETTEEGLLTPVIESECLVLDELVGTRPSEWVKERLAYIINARYNARRPTIITTTLIFGDRSRTPGQGPFDDASLAREARESQRPAAERSLDEFEEFGRQIASRFFEMCKPIEVVADDYRRTVKLAAHRHW
jgi:DNA replication protein DnaC